MKLEFVKGFGGSLSPASDLVAEKMLKFKSSDIYEVEIKRPRNSGFHGKVFKFFQFCFEYWCGNKQTEFMDLPAQFDTFRKNLTVLAGYRVETYTIDGSVRVEAESLSFGNMDQAEFEACYSALINAAIRHVFAGTTDEQILNRLQSFF